jgi:hypothetical protein
MDTMSEHNPNNSPPLRVVYSPLGEKFEVSPANFYDLTRNANWTEQKPHPDTVRDYCEKNGIEVPADDGEAVSAPAPAPESAPAPVESPVPVVEPAPAETPAEEAPAAEEQTASGEAPEEVQEADQAPAVKTVPSDFADMDKDAVKAYIEATFPGTEIDGRKGRDALVAQALELAAARNA